MNDSLGQSNPEDLLPLVRLLISRLERLSVDSYWAHQASGVRGALLRRVEAGESGSMQAERVSLEQLLALGFEMLEQGAKEMQAGSKSGDVLRR